MGYGLCRVLHRKNMNICLQNIEQMFFLCYPIIIEETTKSRDTCVLIRYMAGAVALYVYNRCGKVQRRCFFRMQR